jgi:hypothetical protein
MEELHQDSGVGKDDSETDGNTLPQFLCGPDTHSNSLIDFGRKGQFSLQNPTFTPNRFYATEA